MIHSGIRNIRNTSTERNLREGEGMEECWEINVCGSSLQSNQHPYGSLFLVERFNSQQLKQNTSRNPCQCFCFVFRFPTASFVAATAGIRTASSLSLSDVSLCLFCGTMEKPQGFDFAFAVANKIGSLVLVSSHSARNPLYPFLLHAALVTTILMMTLSLFSLFSSSKWQHHKDPVAWSHAHQPHYHLFSLCCCCDSLFLEDPWKCYSRESLQISRNKVPLSLPSLFHTTLLLCLWFSWPAGDQRDSSCSESS